VVSGKREYLSGIISVSIGGRRGGGSFVAICPLYDIWGRGIKKKKKKKPERSKKLGEAEIQLVIFF